MKKPLRRRDQIPTSHRVVVKVGSSSLTGEDGHLDIARLERLVNVLSERRLAGREVVLVSSGAQAAALGPLELPGKPKDLATAQAAASVGQGLLMAEYTRAFGRHDLRVGQVLLTAEDILRRGQYRNSRRALERLLSLGVVPIINENDTVATDEIRFGDNDRLAALVAHLVQADALVLLTDVDGLYDSPPSLPGARKLTEIHRFEEVEHLDIRARGSKVGTGGMVTKVQAAALATSSGIPVLLTSADEAAEAMAGQEVGTWFHPTGRRLPARQLWLAYAAKIHGQVVIDEGAVRAVGGRGASLLPAGVVGVNGTFRPGQAVEIVSESGLPIARGLSGFSSSRIPEVMGRSMAEIEEQLGHDYAHEVVHRDELVVMARHRRLSE
ncbi:glutamate 5-kinase [Scrofimicrobium sp. R131]|uniref:Glutamate 5-kinase n=1 Tax=Scrofimicrobium appendicitidis TaxID=3079930 RepID=A0AAU7V4V7_9ACTO